jgi:dihydropteroate synthase
VTSALRAPAGTDASPHPLSRVLAGRRPQVCGILNVTPDSFSDGGRFDRLDRAVEQGCTLAAEGADLIDIGGESTRPGARPPTVAEEVDRVVPVVEALVRQVPVPLSVDTSRPEVMQAAVAAGASMVNDVRALRLPGAWTSALAPVSTPASGRTTCWSIRDSGSARRCPTTSRCWRRWAG